MHGYLSAVFIFAIDNDHWKVHLYIYLYAMFSQGRAFFEVMQVFFHVQL